MAVFAIVSLLFVCWMLWALFSIVRSIPEASARLEQAKEDEKRSEYRANRCRREALIQEMDQAQRNSTLYGRKCAHSSVSTYRAMLDLHDVTFAALLRYDEFRLSQKREECLRLLSLTGQEEERQQ